MSKAGGGACTQLLQIIKLLRHLHKDFSIFSFTSFLFSSGVMQLLFLCLALLSLFSLSLIFCSVFVWNVDCLENLGEGTDHGLELSKREGMTEKWKKIRP